MKIRRMTALLLILLLLLSLFPAASAEMIEPVWIFNARSVMLNPYSDVLIVEGMDSRKYGLYDAYGNALTEEKYILIEYCSANLYQAAEEKEMNKMGMIDAEGNVIVPMEYGKVLYCSDKWLVGVKFKPGTEENYDVHSHITYEYCLEDICDVYYCGRKVGTLEAEELYFVEPYGDYLGAFTEDGRVVHYDKNLKASDYTVDYLTEYEQADDGIYHCGSGQKAFAEGCTLTSGEVKTDVWQLGDRLIDLQGNTLFTLSGYVSFAVFRGEYSVAADFEKEGIIDRSGQMILPAEYDEIPPADCYFPSGYQQVVKGGKVGYVNLDGEVTCDFKYSQNDVTIYSQELFGQIGHSDGSVSVLSAAVGELPGRYAEIDTRNNCPIFAAANDQEQAGVLNLYGEELIVMDGKYTGTYNFQLSDDGRVVVAKAGREYCVYCFTDEQTGAYTRKQSAEPTQVPAPQDQFAESDGSWTCSRGHASNAKFCPECGEARPIDDGSWTCSRGHVNTTKFCSECGEARPADRLKCAKCGYEPEAGTAPKFCGECGNAF